jgi:hypothetical protein
MNGMATVKVNVDNFVRAETDRMFTSIQQLGGGVVNRLHHNRGPAPLDDQRVIRTNRDTLYSSAVVDISQSATLTVPDAGERYLSVMVVNQDHYIDEIIHESGKHELTVDRFDTDYVAIAARILADPNDPVDIAAVNDLQDQFRLTAAAGRPFVPTGYDTASLDATREALLSLARGIDGFARSFGTRDQVDPVRHLIGTAAGWGGLPDAEAFYLNVEPHLPVGDYELTVGDVPVDGFWSISVYNAAGYFVPNDRGVVSVNNITADRNDDATITVRFGGGDQPNTIPIMDGWNYAVRLYRPRREILDQTWTFPTVTPSASAHLAARGL